MLNNSYKIFAKALVKKLTNHMKVWITKEQKGFIKGRFILDIIITIWEGLEMVEETLQDYVFFKVDFEKKYEKISWK